jgi:hypothetical protein
LNRLVGHVNWQARPAQPNNMQQLPLTLTLKSGATEANYPSQDTSGSGVFTQTTGLPAGAYNWRVKGPKYLAISGPVTLAPGAANSVEMGMLRVGDANDDNLINVFDFSIMKPTFGRSQGEPSYDDRADFTGEHLVNVMDFSYLKQNFGSGGAPPLGPWQAEK